MAAGDIKLAYNAPTTVTMTLASLASSSTRLVGRESQAISNSSTLAFDTLVAGKVTTGTSPTADRRIEVWLYGSVDGSVYPDTLTGTDSARTITTANIKRSGLKLAAVMLTDSTSNRQYSWGPLSVAELFGGILPVQWGVFITHDTGVNLHATGSNHYVYQKSVFSTVAP